MEYIIALSFELWLLFKRFLCMVLYYRGAFETVEPNVFRLEVHKLSLDMYSMPFIFCDQLSSSPSFLDLAEIQRYYVSVYINVNYTNKELISTREVPTNCIYSYPFVCRCCSHYIIEDRNFGP
jgi:hypothetical protein